MQTPEQRKEITEIAEIENQNRDLFDLVNHAGWKIARKLLTDSILELQSVAEYTDIIQTGNATKLMKEMKANKRVAEMLFDWLRKIEGGAAEMIKKEIPTGKSSFIVDLDKE